MVRTNIVKPVLIQSLNDTSKDIQFSDWPNNVQRRTTSSPNLWQRTNMPNTSVDESTGSLLANWIVGDKMRELIASLTFKIHPKGQKWGWKIGKRGNNCWCPHFKSYTHQDSLETKVLCCFITIENATSWRRYKRYGYWSWSSFCITKQKSPIRWRNCTKPIEYWGQRVECSINVVWILSHHWHCVWQFANVPTSVCNSQNEGWHSFCKHSWGIGQAYLFACLTDSVAMVRKPNQRSCW